MFKHKLVTSFCLAVLTLMGTQKMTSQTARQPNPLERIHVIAAPHAGASAPAPNPFLKPDLYPLAQVFANDPFAPRNAASGTSAINPFNADGTELWPCLGEFTANSAANTDCPTIGNPSQPLPAGGVVVGVPQFNYTRTQCAQLNFIPCAQEDAFLENDTKDTSDYLVISFIGTQPNGNVVLDFGTVVEGPISQAIPQVIPGPFDIILSFATNLGTAGVPDGINNGNCFANFNYPVASTNPTFPFIISDNRHCSDPVDGPVTLTVVTQLAQPKFTQTTQGCPTGETTCFTVTFTPTFKTPPISNTIFLTD